MTESISPLRVAVAGEALIDLVALADGHYQPCLGGAVYNLARALACQGVGTLYLNPFSGDRSAADLRARWFRVGFGWRIPSLCPRPLRWPWWASAPTGTLTMRSTARAWPIGRSARKA